MIQGSKHTAESRAKLSCAAKNRVHGGPYRKVGNPEYENERNHDRKLQAVLAAGGKCVDCGFDDLSRLECFDFDHRDPSTKLPRLREGRRYSAIRLPAEVLALELQKCDLVCSNCHRTRTWGKS